MGSLGTSDAILHFDKPGDPESTRQAIFFMGLVPHHEDTDNVLSADDFTKATTLHRSIVGLSRNGTLWHEVEQLVRKALIEILQHNEFIEKIDGKKREEFLDGLIFDRIP